MMIIMTMKIIMCNNYTNTNHDNNYDDDDIDSACICNYV